ncbi:hypothetical protein L6249_00190 [Candidatus Parcubacteria bacterium]|nr:hypothetical protein [Candidatus Parcubacteria bacterium]
MKNCQEQNKKFEKFNKKISLIVFLIIFTTGLFRVNNCFAQKAGSAFDANSRVTDPITAKYIEIVAPLTNKEIEDAKGINWKVWLNQNGWDMAIEAAKQSAGQAFKTALAIFLNTIAQETAVYLASGDKGQKPMFITEGWGDYLANTADRAAGYFIEDLGKAGIFGTKFNLCEPDLAVKLQITYGLIKWQKPPAPKCTFSKMKQNWEKSLKDPDFLKNFQAMFEPGENDLGIALSLQTSLSEEIEKKANEAELMRKTNQGIKDVTDPISGYIKTPASAVARRMGIVLENAITKEKTYTGTVADAIDLFFNTLIGKLFESWFNKGLVTDFDKYEGWKYDGDYESQAANTGIAGAKERFRTLIEPEFGIRGDYNILSELTSCPDPTKAGPTNCVITDSFRQAVINRLTVGEAMKQGYLNSGGIFGFTADGLEPAYYEGYPYRSMIILRKFRITPVGWEVAAQYIKDFGDKTYNLGDMVACFDSSDDYEGYFAAWCQGLVDPNWVLKAPLNYCKREGAGPEIISERVIGAGESSELSISRKDTYCADEQACIKENDDGSCQLYGYCSEERRKWQFNGNGCEPKYNTCQTFKSKDGKTISYLENTLDYGICNVDNVGCKPYCVDYDFTNSEWSCTNVSVNDKLYLDKNAEECGSEDEGCHEFIRTKAGIGANLLKNSSFEDFTGTIDDGAADTFGFWGNVGQAVSGGYGSTAALKLTANLNKTIAVGPADYSVANDSFTLSFYAKDCAAGDSFNIDGQAVKDLSDSADWQYYAATYIYPSSASGNQVIFNINTASCAVDAVKLERDTTATAYNDYREAGLVYQKLAPDYLNCAGATPPAECDNFARTCAAADVNCELYTSAKERVTVPAKAAALDYCPAECSGYDGYIQSESAFDSLRESYFIPETAKTCDAASAGCDQFTNLDEAAKGGEGIEYYSYLRQCVKPSDPAADCAEFYTWEGSDETGFQLRMHNLQQDGGEPAVTEDDSLECDVTIYSLPPTDPAYNPDCREFYGKSGLVFYHLYTRTITCDNNCHPYRRTEKNIDPDLNAATCNAVGSGYANVTNSQFHWDVDLLACYFCKNNGEWSDESQACVYMAIPGQGVKCSGAKNGCREYKGNTGNNIRIISTNDFEGSLQGWAGVGGTTLSLSNEALTAGGNSLYASGGTFSAEKTVGNLVKKDKSYVLSFIAKPSGASQINFKFINGSGETADFGAVALNAGWQLYKINLAALGHNVDAGETLAFTANGNFYIDNIRLTEIIDRWYLIKESWNTPDSCYNDITGVYAGPYYNAGCEQYYDRDKNTHYLRQFSQLCKESVVGCEIMIDTHNSSDYNSQTFNAGDPSQVVVPADGFAYVIYDKTKQCNQSDKGCQRLGSPFQYGNSVLYDDIYLKNDPDKYNEILCQADAVYCGEWTSDDGTVYFKDPGDAVCEWRQKLGQASEAWGWYKKKIKRCDDNGNGTIDAPAEGDVCLDGNDCANGVSCISDENDYGCSVSSYKTLGTGRVAVSQPSIDAGGNYWAGICPAVQSGCSEYIEPVSRFSVSMLFNGDFSQNVDLNAIADGWSAAANGTQDIKLDTNTLYVLMVEGANTAKVNITNNDFYELDANNNLTGPVNQISVVGAVGSRASKRFYARVSVSAKITASNSAPGNNSKVELKQAAVDYQLKQDLDDSSCNGIVNFEEGCVLFNERAQDGSALAGLTWDADLTVNDGNGVVPKAGVAGERDGNILLKVSPDRVCDKWLACRSYIKDEKGNNVCFDIGLCNGVDDNGSCNSFVITNQVNQTYNTLVQNIGNMSGYAKVGYNGSSLEADYYPLGAMEQAGEVAGVANGGFEFYGSNKYPIGWTWTGGNWDENVFTVINNPITAQTEGIGYAPEGRSFLKLGSVYSATSEFIDVERNMDYILTAYVNTINLSVGSAAVKIEQFDSNGNSVATNVDVVTLSGGNEWTYQLGNFKTLAAAARIKITLHSQNSAVGNFYFDDVKIRPALNSKASWYTPQTCRLYPESDSLSCDYYEDSGKRQKGWLGYCLEHDRYPGSDNACVLWWPVDKVKGEGVEEGAGYLDRFPLYYCKQFTARRLALVESRQSVNFGYADSGSDECSGAYCNGCGCSGACTCPSGYWFQSVEGSSSWGGNPNWVYCNANAGEVSPCAGWYYYNGDLQNFGGNAGSFNEASYGAKLCDLDTGELFATNEFGNLIYCTNIAQTVTSVGQNKYWSGRVYKGSDYIVPLLNYEYTAGYQPFGGVVQPFPDNNPYEWDSVVNTDTDKNIQPLYVTSFVKPADYLNEVNAGSPYSCTGQCGKTGLCSLTRNFCYDLNTSTCANPVAPISFANTLRCPSGEICQTPFPVLDIDTGKELIKRLFAQSYGTWQWDGSHYVSVSGQDWSVPVNLCNGTGIAPRPAYPNDFCGILPIISNIKVNSGAGDIELNNNQFINLTFNSDVDSQQLPLVMYAVNWGDNEYTVVTGVEMRDRPNADNPHSLYHLYSYWDLKAKRVVNQALSGGANSVYCGSAGNNAVNYSGIDSGYDCPAASACCIVKPSAKIKDNWGWCNNGVNGAPCPAGGYKDFGGWIVVREK